MKFGPGSTVGPIAVDIDDDELRLVQLEARAEGARVVAAVRRELPGSLPEEGEARHAAVARLTAEVAARGGFVGKRLVTSAPASAVHVKNLRLPRMPADELAGAVAWEARERLQVKGEPILTRFFDAGDIRQGEETRREIIVLALPEAYAEGHTAAMIGKRFDLDAIEAPAAGIARLLQSVEGDGPAAVVDVRRSATTVTIVHEGRVLFVKSIAIGGVHFDRAAAARLDLSVEEAQRLRLQFDRYAVKPPAALLEGGDARGVAADRAEDEGRRALFEAVRPAMSDLAREVALCLRYYGVTFRGDRPAGVSLTGPESPSGWLAQLMVEVASVAVGVLDPFARVRVDDDQLADAPVRSSWAVAVGSAMRGLIGPAAGKEAA